MVLCPGVLCSSCSPQMYSLLSTARPGPVIPSHGPPIMNTKPPRPHSNLPMTSLLMPTCSMCLLPASTCLYSLSCFPRHVVSNIHVHCIPQLACCPTDKQDANTPPSSAGHSTPARWVPACPANMNPLQPGQQGKCPSSAMGGSHTFCTVLCAPALGKAPHSVCPSLDTLPPADGILHSALHVFTSLLYLTLFYVKLSIFKLIEVSVSRMDPDTLFLDIIIFNK